jgi:large subunit ribosomal protein L21
MYAIIKTGGRQHRVTEGQSLRVELLHADVGSTVTLDEVLLVGSGESVKIGRPFLSGAAVTASVTRHARAKKVLVFKKKRRKGFHKKIGHRQFFTELKITGISG